MKAVNKRPMRKHAVFFYFILKLTNFHFDISLTKVFHPTPRMHPLLSLFNQVQLLDNRGMKNSKFEQELKMMGGPSTPGADFKNNLEASGKFFNGLNNPNKNRPLIFRILIIVFSLITFVGFGGAISYLGFFGIKESSEAIIPMIIGIVMVLAGFRIIYSNLK